MHRFTLSHSNVTSGMPNIEALWHTSQDPSFNTASNKGKDDLPIWNWEVTLDDGSTTMDPKMKTASPRRAAGRIRNSQNESHNDKEDVHSNKQESAVKELIASELTTMVKKSLGDILGMSYYIIQSPIRSALDSVRRQVMLDQLCKSATERRWTPRFPKFSTLMQRQTLCRKAHWLLARSWRSLLLLLCTWGGKLFRKMNTVLHLHRRGRSSVWKRIVTISSHCRAVQVPGVQRFPGRNSQNSSQSATSVSTWYTTEKDILYRGDYLTRRIDSVWNKSQSGELLYS